MAHKNNDIRVADYEPLRVGEYVLKNRNDPGNDEIKETESSMLSHPGIFVLAHSKKIMNNFVQEIDRFYLNKAY